MITQEILQTLRRNMRLVALEDTFAQSLTAQTDNNTGEIVDHLYQSSPAYNT
jgi:hypothetical protein